MVNLEKPVELLPARKAFNKETIYNLKLLHHATSLEYPPVLSENSLDGLKQYIEDKKCENVIVLAGAGMSTSAGIPDFHTPEHGLFEKLRQEYNMDQPMVVFEVEFFLENPFPFYKVLKDHVFLDVEPTPAHYFVKLLEKKRMLRRLYTQNIDGLDRKVDISEDKLIEANGRFKKPYCTKCKKDYSVPWLKDQIKDADAKAPYCLVPDCKALVRPDIVFLNEQPPSKFFSHAKHDFEKCDLLIIMGNSLGVEPFASLVDLVPRDCPRILINQEVVGVIDGPAMLERLEKHLLSKEDFDTEGVEMSAKFAPVAGLKFNDPSNRDIALIGDCNEGVKKFAETLGWTKELDDLIDGVSPVPSPEQPAGGAPSPGQPAGGAPSPGQPAGGAPSPGQPAGEPAAGPSGGGPSGGGPSGGGPSGGPSAGSSAGPSGGP